MQALLTSIPASVALVSAAFLSTAETVATGAARVVFIATPAVFLTGVILGLQRRGWL